MAKNNQRRLAKEKKARERAARKARKQAQRRARNSTPGQPGDPDIEHIDVGPQQKDKPSDAEVMAAVERAMNPATQGRSKRSASGPRLFVGNLDYGTDEATLRALFTERGFDVTDASVVLDRDTGRSRGFAFVELVSADQAAEAIDAFDGHELEGRALRVNEADR
jgi:nucleolin